MGVRKGQEFPTPGLPALPYDSGFWSSSVNPQSKEGEQEATSLSDDPRADSWRLSFHENEELQERR